MRPLLLLLILALLAPVVYGQDAGAFARMGFGARGVAMGGALVADAFGEASPYYNPSLAPFMARQNVAVSAALLTQDRELQFLQFATPLRPRAGLAAGLIHAGVSDIDGRDNSGYHTATYSTDEFAAFLAFGIAVSERVAIGAGLNYFHADYFDAVSAVNSIGLDVGANVRLTEALRVGVALDDLLARYEWDTSALFGSEGRTTTDDFPTRLRLGAAYRLAGGQALVVAEYESAFRSVEARRRGVVLSGDTPVASDVTEDLRLQENTLRVGGEYRPVDLFAVRAGVDRIGADGLRPGAGFMVEQGLGALVLRAEYGVALEPYALGTMHLITLRVFL